MQKYKYLRMDQIKILAMKIGISCADRYIQWMHEKGLLTGARQKGDATKTWILTTEFNTWPEKIQQSFNTGDLKEYFDKINSDVISKSKAAA